MNKTKAKAKPMKAKSATAKAVSFVTRSEPPEAHDDTRQIKPPTAIAAHNAANPEMRAVRESAIAKFLETFNTMVSGLGTMLNEFVAKAETGRQAGIYLLEFADTLPGKRITRDFYEQCKEMFTDARGQGISLEMLEWLMKVAQKYENPIATMPEALQCRQLLFEASGEPAFQLTGETVVKTRIPPKDEFGRVTEFIEKPDLEEFTKSWEAVKLNPNYFPGGHLRPDLRETIVHEWKPRLERLYPVLAEIRAELGI